jgi:hypothetical protein
VGGVTPKPAAPKEGEIVNRIRCYLCGHIFGTKQEYMDHLRDDGSCPLMKKTVEIDESRLSKLEAVKEAAKQAISLYNTMPLGWKDEMVEPMYLLSATLRELEEQ